MPAIKSVFSIVGASSSVLLVFLLPSSIFLRCVPPDTSYQDYIPDARDAGGGRGSGRVVRALARLLFVLGIGVAATAFTALALP